VFGGLGHFGNPGRHWVEIDLGTGCQKAFFDVDCHALGAQAETPAARTGFRSDTNG
jgi:hypothetical protein